MLQESWDGEVHRYMVQGARFVGAWCEDGGRYEHEQPSRGT